MVTSARNHGEEVSLSKGRGTGERYHRRNKARLNRKALDTFSNTQNTQEGDGKSTRNLTERSQRSKITSNAAGVLSRRSSYTRNAVDASRTTRKSQGGRNSLLVPTQTGYGEYTNAPQTVELKTNLSKSLRMNKNHARKASNWTEGQLASRVMQSLKANRVEPQLLNTMRYEL